MFLRTLSLAALAGWAIHPVAGYVPHQLRSEEATCKKTTVAILYVLPLP